LGFAQEHRKTTMVFPVEAPESGGQEDWSDRRYNHQKTPVV